MAYEEIQQAKKSAKTTGNLLIILGILMIIMGIASIASPFIASTAVTVMVGAMLMATGVMRCIGAFKVDSLGKTLILIALGLLTFLAGVMIIRRPIQGVMALTLFLAIYFFVEGIMEIIFSFNLKPLDGWVMVLFGGIVSVILGILILRQWPWSSVMALGILFGVKVLMSGIGMIALGFMTRRMPGKIEGAVEEVRAKVEEIKELEATEGEAGDNA